MKYRNAIELLPPQLLQILQEYVQGEIFYVPKIKRKPWGEGTGSKTFYSRRDADIRKLFSKGTSLERISDEYYISEDAIKKIVYKKGESIMKEKEIVYTNYFWQNELVRIRCSKPDDWKFGLNVTYDSVEEFFSNYEQNLPQDEESRQVRWENYVKSNENSDERILLAIETLAGEYLGGANLHGIDERNGTFGMFIGVKEEGYALAAAQLLLEYAFNERRLNNCHTGFIANDTMYQPIFQKLGFKLEGTRRQQVFHKGKYWDECLYGLLADEFNTMKN